MICQQYSHQGRKKENQDSTALYSLGKNAVMAMVADGVSTCQKPKLASEMALSRFNEIFIQQYSSGAASDYCMSEALNEANNALYFEAADSRSPALLSTFSSVLFENNKACCLHLGDTRIYRFYQDNLELLSKDDKQQGGYHDGALTEALGYDLGVRAQYFEKDITPGDIFMVVSDGVWQFIDEQEIKQALRLFASGQSLQEDIAKVLCHSAFKAGSRDNLSCIILQFEPERLQSSDASFKKIPKPLTPGQNFDGFVIERIIEQTPRSHVYLARNKDGQERVIKTPSENFADDPLFLNRFIKEERLGLSFQHASLLRFYPKPLHSEYIYHVTEYVEGQTLRDYINEHAPIKLSVVKHLLEKIIISLRVLHRSHLLHQDIKPENIILTKSGEIKIIDLGSVSSLVLHDNQSPPLGALLYTAPEYFSKARIGVHSDIFSLAVVAYEMLAGKLPFSALQLSQNKPLRFTPASKCVSHLPSWVDAIFYRGLAKDSHVRYQALSEFLLDLQSEQHLQSHKQPLIKRNPVLFYQGLSATLAGLLVISHIV